MSTETGYKENLGDLLSLLPGVTDMSGTTYTWTSRPAEPRYDIKGMTLSIAPDGNIVIDTITGDPLDIKELLAEIRATRP